MATSTAALEALEHTHQLLRKDRLQPQILGMESLVALTDPASSGLDTAMYASLAVLGAPVTAGLASDLTDFMTEIHQVWIVQVLLNRHLPGDANPSNTVNTAAAAAVTGNTSVSADPTTARTLLSAGGDGGNVNKVVSSPQQQLSSSISNISSISSTLGDEHHGGMMRSLALRAFTNALTLLDRQQPKILQNVLQVQSLHLVGAPVLQALQDDVRGANRPPGVTVGTRLASQHEAALAVRCLRLLGVHSPAAKRKLLSQEEESSSYLSSSALLPNLKKAKLVGAANHDVLATEADAAHVALTEDARSC
jgi:hypothetical protein